MSFFAARLAAVLATILVAVGVAGPARAAEQILAYDSVVTVRADGVLDVTETIRVRAEGNQIKHGIYRDFPLTFVDGDGRSHRVSFKLLGVLRDGKPEPNHQNWNNSGVRVYAGSQDVFLRPGEYTYRFHYETGRQIRFLPDHTELFWNVTGNDWAFPILRAATAIRLPDGRAPVRWTAYTGTFGQTGGDFAARIGGDNALIVSTTRALRPGEGLSVVVQIPDGLVARPSGAQAFYYWFLDNRRYVFGGLGFAGVLIFYLITWAAVGRDPPKGVVIPLFHPPAGISPALAGYVHDWGWHRQGWRAFTAAAISLAVKGLLVFDDSAESIVLTRTGKEPAEKLPPGERSILGWVGGRGGKVTVNSSSGKSVATALSTFKASVEGENRDRFFRRNLGYYAIGGILTVATLAVVLIFGDLSEAEISALFVVGFACVFLGVFIIPVIRAITSGFGVRSIASAGLNIVVLVIIFGGFISVFVSASQSLPDDFGRSIVGAILRNAFPFILIGGFAAMNGLFFYLLRAPTAAGRKVMDDIAGLELYIRTAETDRLNAVGAPDLDTTQFERLLPYAIALNAEKPWSQAFEKAFARAHPSEGATLAYAPGWHGGLGWSGDGFASSLASSVSAAQGSFASSVPAPSSSSSGFSGGGGGGSGGGGGGGGGGGW